MRKRRGSAVLTILAVSMVLMLLGGILLNVIMSTTKGNEDSNRRQDLKYGAEGGIEIARSYLAKNGYKEVNDAIIETEINKNAEILTEAKTPESNVTDMNIELEEKDGKIKITSVAKYNKNGKNIEEKAKCSVARGHNGNFMDHGLVGGSGGVQMDDKGHVDLGDTSTSVGKDGDGMKYPINVTEPKPENKHTNEFGELEFKNEGRLEKIEADMVNIGELSFVKQDKLVVKDVAIKIDTQGDKTITSIVGSSMLPKEYMETLKAPVIRMEIVDGAKGDGDLYMYNPKIYIINAKSFDLKCSGSINVYNTIIINSGDMKITGNISFNMHNSTFIANKLETGTNVSMNIKGQANKVDNNGYGVFSEEEEKALNELINAVIPNWSENNTGGSDFTVEGYE